MTTGPASETPGRRGAEATRRSILAAARSLFSTDGFDQVGMRQIAAAAGVDAALIVRYFGSKDGLLRESIADSFVMDPELLAGPRADLGRTLARFVVTKDPASTDFDPVLILLRAAGNQRAAALLRESFDQQLVEPLADWLGGERALTRAGLIVGELFGVVFSRYILRSHPMVAADPETLIDLVGSTLQALIDDRPGNTVSIESVGGPT